MTRRPRRGKRIVRAFLAIDLAAACAMTGTSAAADDVTAATDTTDATSDADRLLARVSLSYEAPPPPRCPSRTALAGAVARRIEPAWLTRADTRNFSVRIARDASGAYTGKLDVEHGGRTRGREIHAKTCAEVTAALAVFIAIALDPVMAQEPDELREPPPSGPAEGPPPSSSGTTTPPAASPPSVPPETAAVRPPPPPGPLATTPRPYARLNRPSLPNWTWSSGVGVTYLRVPQSAWGARVSAQLARRLAGGHLSPALRVSWGFADFATFPERAGKVAFRYETAQIAACAVVDFASLPLTLTPCAGAELGTLQSTARDLPRGAHVEGAWRAAHASARAAWAFLPWLSVEVEAGALFPLERSTFGLSQPPRVAYQAPAVIFASSAGLAVQARFR